MGFYTHTGHMISYMTSQAHLLEEPGGKGVSELPVLQKQESPEGSEVSADVTLREEVIH